VNGPAPLQEVLKHARANSAALAATYSTPVLLVAPEQPGTGSLHGEHPDDDDDGPMTQTLPAVALGDVNAMIASGQTRAPANFDAPNTLVVPVQRRMSKSKEPKISFGRATICDVVLNYSPVSKHHGYFEEQVGVWHVFDVGSTNGTVLDGKNARRQEGRAHRGDAARRSGVAVRPRLGAVLVGARLRRVARAEARLSAVRLFGAGRLPVRGSGPPPFHSSRGLE
jgi:hypothetical protein